MANANAFFAIITVHIWYWNFKLKMCISSGSKLRTSNNYYKCLFSNYIGFKIWYKLLLQIWFPVTIEFVYKLDMIWNGVLTILLKQMAIACYITTISATRNLSLENLHFNNIKVITRILAIIYMDWLIDFNDIHEAKQPKGPREQQT